VRDQTLEVIPLGGLGGFGLNMMVIRFGSEAIIVDAGLGFPDSDLPGVEILIPDFTFIREHYEEILAVVLTHGHDDHIGALAFLLREIALPVYGTHFTLALLAESLKEHGILGSAELHGVEPGDTASLGSWFTVEWIHVTHSLTCCTALAISTPVGVLIHSGDFKVDETPVIGAPFDLERLTQIGDDGVLALFLNVTNVERAGRTPSESSVIPSFERSFLGAAGRIIVSCVSSSVHRIQIVLDVANQTDRKVALLGRSMTSSVETAESNGQLFVPDGLLISAAEARRVDRDRVVLLAAGCQGDPRSAMTRLATDQHKNLSVTQGDLVMLSARHIPGNERAVSRLISHCYRRGGTVVDSSVQPIHVSGHGSQEDLRLMIEATRPKFVVPIHAEHRMFYRFKEWVTQRKILSDENVVIIENGDVLQLGESQARVMEKAVIGRTFIDGGREQVEDMVARDRRHLSNDGIVVAFVVVNPSSGGLESEPEVLTRGFVHEEISAELISRLKQLIEETVADSSHEERIDYGVIKEKIRLALKRYIQRATGRRPMIIPVVVEV